jgi:hypothetical protein
LVILNPFRGIWKRRSIKARIAYFKSVLRGLEEEIAKAKSFDELYLLDLKISMVKKQILELEKELESI